MELLFRYRSCNYCQTSCLDPSITTNVTYQLFCGYSSIERCGMATVQLRSSENDSFRVDREKNYLFKPKATELMIQFSPRLFVSLIIPHSFQ